MVGFIYSPGCKCCESEPTCLIARDTFDRASVGSGWDQDSGSWVLGDDNLYTASENARLEYQTNHPGSIASHIVHVSFRCEDDGNKARIWLADTLFAEVQVASDGCGTLRLIQEVGESGIELSGAIGGSPIGSGPVGGSLGSTDTTEVVLASTPVERCVPERWMLLTACYHYGDSTSDCRFIAKLDVGAPASLYDPLPRYFILDEKDVTATGLKVGLATGGAVTSEVRFDNFYWYTHKSDYKDFCNDCLECLIHEDRDFGFVDTGDLSCSWDDEAGSWTYYQPSPSAVPAIQTTDDDARLIQQVEHSEHAWNTHFKVFGNFTAEQDAHRFYLFYTDPTDCIMVELKMPTYDGYDTQFDGWLRVYDGGTLVLNQVGPIIQNSWHNYYITLCTKLVDGDLNLVIDIYARQVFPTTSPYSLQWHTITEISTRDGARYGVGTGDLQSYGYAVDGIATFWEPVFRRSYNEDNPSCIECDGPRCDYCGTTPDTWTVAAAGFTSAACNCTPLNGSTIVPLSTNDCVWETQDLLGCNDELGDPWFITKWRVTVTEVTGGFRIALELWTESQEYSYGIWAAEVTDGSHCTDVDELELTYVGNSIYPLCLDVSTPPPGPVTITITAN
jgi:hypothetical protein